MRKKIFILIIFYLLAASFFHKNIFAQFTEMNSGINTPLNSIVPTGWVGLNTVNVWACGDNGVVLKTTNSGINWINTGTGIIPTDINLNVITYSSSNSLVALTSGVRLDTAIVYRTSNGGSNWQIVFRQYQGNINAIFINSPAGILIGNPVNGRWSIWKTSNDGVTWDSSGIYLAQNGNEIGWKNSFCYTQPFEASYMLFGTNNSRVYYSTNLGNTWQFSTVPQETNITSMHFPFYVSMNSFLGYIGGSTKVLFTSNSGLNWIDAGPALGSGNIAGIHACPLPVDNVGFHNIFFTRSDSNIYLFPYSSVNCTLVYSAPSGKYRYISNRAGSFQWAVRDNGGITMCGCQLGGIQQIENEIPECYILAQNYPNPFNPTTNIEFRIAKSGFVNITIYDASGREVETLGNQELKPGTYKVDWNASVYPSGVYFYRLSTDNFSETKKMVLLK